MAVEVAMNTPLADALSSAIQPKLVEAGWASDGGDDSPLSEFIILMLVNGKSQDEIASELAGDLLGLGPDDPTAKDFARWLFEQIDVLNAQINGGAAPPQGQPAQDGSMDQDMDMGMSAPDTAELNAYVTSPTNTATRPLTRRSPTGPKSMRNGDARGGFRGGKRMLGQMNRAMDRTHENSLHRVRGTGNERINAHGRTPPTGPRGGLGRNNRGNNNRANNIAHGMASQMNAMAAGGMPQMPGMPGMPDMNWVMQGGAGGQGQGQGGDIFQLLQQQNQMMAALSQQLAQSQHNNMGNRGRGRSLHDRTQRGGNFRRGGHHGNGQQQNEGNGAGGEGGDDVDMARQAADPETVVCKYNLSCTNRECKFAHQSPAAPPGMTIDVNDVCSYGAACKNFKCVGRHPSPATKRAHQNEQFCRFYPNCTNPKCPFKHPEMPLCRNGADCKTEGCKFTHLQTKCKFTPCTNRYCPYKHEEGQRGAFHDKVWTADGNKEHVSERQFAADGGEELVVPVSDDNTMDETVA